jgi:N-sulfoglucosamine sulfohydrolase
VSFADIFPTILDWARVPRPDQESLRARSILPILEEANPAGWDEIYASQSFHEVTSYYPMRAVRTRQHKLIVNLASSLPFPIAEDVFDSETWKGIIRHPEPSLGDRPFSPYIQRPKIELYDVLADPAESKNLASDSAHASLMRDLEQRLFDWRDKTADPWLVKSVHE